MLEIAIPKSAGTALGKTLSKLQGLKFCEGSTHYKESKDLDCPIERIHGSMGGVKEEDIEKFKEKETIYHEHIFPTKKNIELLKNQKKVILLREPEEILHSWWRAEQSGIHPKHPMLKDCKTEEEYVKKAKELGALKIFKDFKQGWEKAKSKDDLIIYYKDLKNNPKETVNKVERHLGLPESEKVELLKAKYGRRGKIGRVIKKIYGELARINPLRKLKRKLLPNFTFG